MLREIGFPRGEPLLEVGHDFRMVTVAVAALADVLPQVEEELHVAILKIFPVAVPHGLLLPAGAFNAPVEGAFALWLRAGEVG